MQRCWRSQRRKHPLPKVNKARYSRSKMRESHWKNAVEIEVSKYWSLCQHSWKLLCPWVKLCRNLRNTVTGLCLSETGTLSRFCKPEGSTIEYKNTCTCKPEERTPPQRGCTVEYMHRQPLVQRGCTTTFCEEFSSLTENVFPEREPPKETGVYH